MPPSPGYACNDRLIAVATCLRKSLEIPDPAVAAHRFTPGKMRLQSCQVRRLDAVNTPSGYTPWCPHRVRNLLTAMKEHGIVKTSRPVRVWRPLPVRTSERILVVNEDRDLRLVYANVLDSSGYRVDGTEDGTAAWAALNHAPYDLLITENRLPWRSGADLLQKLHAARMSVPVILLSDLRPTAAMGLHPRLSYDAILFKPHTSEELVAVVQETLLACSAAAARTPMRSNAWR